MSTNTPPATLNWLPFDPNRSDLEYAEIATNRLLRFSGLPLEMCEHEKTS